MTRNIIIENATIVTPEGRSARKGEAMASVKVIENATLVARDGKITFVGPMAEMPQLQLLSTGYSFQSPRTAPKAVAAPRLASVSKERSLFIVRGG